MMMRRVKLIREMKTSLQRRLKADDGKNLSQRKVKPLPWTLSLKAYGRATASNGTGALDFPG